MQFVFDSVGITTAGRDEISVSDIFRDEMQIRGAELQGNNTLEITLKSDAEIENKDEYIIDFDGSSMTFAAKGIRGLIFAVGEFLRNTEYSKNKIILTKDISGKYSPYMSIRGHQLGYRDTPNTYDAWDISDYVRYYKDLMFFGTNTVEHIPTEDGVSSRNALMKYDEIEFARMACEEADKLDLDVSLWMPNCEKDYETAIRHREKVFSELKRIDAVFPPGGDPGKLDPEEMFARSEDFYEILKRNHPDAKIWPSAQEPRNKENWGGRFIAELEKFPEHVGGVIQGPNRAFSTHELRKRVPADYPLRFYPDITHNVRCEHPVHFLEDDWNYALCTVNGRESFNPRPSEYAKLHKLTYKYFIGSVSYSEGVNDDVNKALWSALDFNPHKPVREIIEEYARLFFYGADIKKVTDGIFGLEKNWEGKPEENPSIDFTYGIFANLGRECPDLNGRWRYLLCMLRATTDKFAKDKLVFENGIIADAIPFIRQGKLAEAKDILSLPLPDEIMSMRRDIDAFADKLFKLIGMQLGTKDYFAAGWERGAILDIIDLPVSDLPYILGKLDLALKGEKTDAVKYMNSVINRNRIDKDEFYFSFALDELYALGVRQTPDFYMDFQGDRPDVNNGTLPVCCFKCYDHFGLKCRTAGFTPGVDYTLMISYKGKPDTDTVRHKISANGHVIYEGPQFGGERNADFERDMLPSGYSAVMYKLPASVFENGCLELEITEPTGGFVLSEFRITKNEYKS